MTFRDARPRATQHQLAALRDHLAGDVQPTAITYRSGPLRWQRCADCRLCLPVGEFAAAGACPQCGNGGAR